jgi:hypothetical protein
VKLRTLFAAFLLFFASVAHAQTPGENLRVYLLTFGPGDAVFEKFGHNAIWVHDTSTDFGVAYNWGMFSFDQPGFVPRLMKGRMLYWMAGYEVNAFVQDYLNHDRSVWAQELNLTPAQREAMREFVEWNSRDENKFYLYDYYRDNCSTRVRDAIDRVTGGALKRSLEPVMTTSTFRSHTKILTESDIPVFTGTNLALGRRVDVPLNAWQESFLPLELREWVRTVKVRGADGSEQPLVLAERTINEARGRAPLPEQAPGRIVPYTIVGMLMGGVMLLLARAGRSRRWAVVSLAGLVAVWSFLIGFFGLLITLLWAATDHVATYGNENLLQANPLALALAVLAPAALLGKLRPRRWAAWIALLIAGLSGLGFMIQILPQLDQANGEIIGLMFPVHSAIAWILWQRWHVDPAKLSAHHPSL